MGVDVGEPVVQPPPIRLWLSVPTVHGILTPSSLLSDTTFSSRLFSRRPHLAFDIRTTPVIIGNNENEMRSCGGSARRGAGNSAEPPSSQPACILMIGLRTLYLGSLAVCWLVLSDWQVDLGELLSSPLARLLITPELSYWLCGQRHIGLPASGPSSYSRINLPSVLLSEA